VEVPALDDGDGIVDCIDLGLGDGDVLRERRIPLYRSRASPRAFMNDSSQVAATPAA
jgi:hypothetical protein